MLHNQTIRHLRDNSFGKNSGKKFGTGFLLSSSQTALRPVVAFLHHAFLFLALLLLCRHPGFHRVHRTIRGCLRHLRTEKCQAYVFGQGLCYSPRFLFQILELSSAKPSCRRSHARCIGVCSSQYVLLQYSHLRFSTVSFPHSAHFSMR